MEQFTINNFRPPVSTFSFGYLASFNLQKLSGLGSEAQRKNPQSAPFYLNLDSSITIPIVLTSPSSSIDKGMGQGDPPGKFYQPEPALSLLNTLRTGGSSAKFEVASSATEEQKGHFVVFRSRLQSGELVRLCVHFTTFSNYHFQFIAIAGTEVLAFCSADNALLSQRLNVPPILLGHPEDLIVSRVIIEHYSAYADAAVHADSRRWSQHLSLA